MLDCVTPNNLEKLVTCFLNEFLCVIEFYQRNDFSREMYYWQMSIIYKFPKHAPTKRSGEFSISRDSENIKWKIVDLGDT